MNLPSITLPTPPCPPPPKMLTVGPPQTCSAGSPHGPISDDGDLPPKIPQDPYSFSNADSLSLTAPETDVPENILLKSSL